MQVDSTVVIDPIYSELHARVAALAKRNIMPHLVVIFVGQDASSAAYIKQKEKNATLIGAKVTVLNFPTTITTEELVEKITLLNVDPYVHGILIQRPLPAHIDTHKLELATEPEKDIDGFHPDSPYTLPLPLAVMRILEHIYASSKHPASRSSQIGSSNVLHWLQSQNIVVLGKGATGGKPIIQYLRKQGIKPQIIDSTTQSPEKILQKADIIISAIGKAGIVKKEYLKQDVILIGVGMTSGVGKKLHGDYVETDIQSIASFFTPTPKGVGPVNVAMLMSSLVTATEKQNKMKNER